MKVTYLGVGEGFDETVPTTSVLIECSEGNILIDCGAPIPHQLWRLNSDPDFIDVVYITHQHQDHSFGLPSLIVRAKEDGRTKPLIVCCHPYYEEFVKGITEYGMPGIMPLITYPLEFVSFEKEWSWKGVTFRIAPTSHYIPNYAVRVEVDGKVIAYSGDGNITPETEELFQGADLLVHEAYRREDEIEGHGNMKGVKELAKKLQLKQVDLVHLNRNTRKERKENEAYIQGWASIPEPGDTREL